MKLRTQLDRLVAELERRGALMDDAADRACVFLAPFEYPRLFKELVQTHCFAAFDVAGVRVYSNLHGEDDSLVELISDEILTRALCAAGFAPFGRPATGSYDRVCFDMRARKRSFDAPVVVMDHEAILTLRCIPKPRELASGLVSLFQSDTVRAEPVRGAKRP